MADINYEQTDKCERLGVLSPQPLGSDEANEAGEAVPSPPEDLIHFAELLFFAYRDFISDPDAMLAEIGFGRAHHRVLHFVCRRPGLRVADLLEILNITKQSLARVLRQLIKEGYIVQHMSETDRRERRLYATKAGKHLIARLTAPQAERLAQALSAAGPEASGVVARFLSQMVSDKTGHRYYAPHGAASAASGHKQTTGRDNSHRNGNNKSGNASR